MASPSRYVISRHGALDRVNDVFVVLFRFQENSVDDTYNREQWAEWRERVKDIEQQLSQVERPLKQLGSRC